MVCINCSSPTRVNNSRLQKRSNQVWRRRECVDCHTVFTTHESTDFNTSVVVQDATKALHPFQRDKLFISIYESCKHRPDAESNASYLTQTVIGLLQEVIRDGLIDRDTIIEIAAKTLGRFDEIAETVYRAYHPPQPKQATN